MSDSTSSPRLETLKSNHTSTNSLFSLSKKSYSSLLLNNSNYYYENEEFDDVDDSYSSKNRDIFTYPYNQYSSGLLTPAPSTEKLDKYVFILIGLPASGKSSISSHLIKYFNSNDSTKHLRCSIYNAGQVRRNLSNNGLPMKLANDSSEDLFNPKNSNKKEKFAKITLNNLLRDVNNDACDIAIFDATNSTKARRKFLISEFSYYNSNVNSSFHIIPIFLQISCNDINFIRYNVHNKSFNDDYYDKPYRYSISDFAKRLRYYCKQSTPFSEIEFEEISSYLKENNLEYEVLYYKICDAGLSNSNQNFVLSTRNHSPFTDMILYLINRFVENYSNLYGHEYITKVKQFFVIREEFQRNSTSDMNCTENSMNCLDTLTEIVNEEYINSLQESLMDNT
ncbi:hypothetical protein Kpol_1039p1 [Vanderwaltozyma polyspora DSM 70294]|uniref:6-phosphofructo-2-kinase domain-containing protein n=1 Tax=Vanderwaltozyma polyspora (strain ATCC 22028 / DSM 70294 / BCRC 21397 / CBS 2163 / NBRC 10782 / NRRL Y-8283 / UCD 57-17) TaxID=436907 RepID=A7THC8_VANPO|nr:uncharacterized protein Kpol_1039p1 [Vanderwaltozyma polyspora DSM 70294]EDO18252.1 hypothetical protein Kpol_1039p1 [Vanderwaltozyma polyspora DSM 70294]